MKSRTVESLQVKKAEIEWAVKAYSEKLHQAQADLSHVTAALAIFEATGDRKATTAYANFNGIWKPRELMVLCTGFLQSEGPLSTRELAQRVLVHSGMDTRDRVLVQTVTNKLIYVMRAQEKRGKVRRAGKRADVCIWAESAK
ncbi:MAG TPA: hypothetical protein VK515_03410 [Rhizomicrobium sp.]|nr:hypothetical protein [Rhizomicrobium sp.]